MYRYEWKKLLKNRFVTVFFCALLILNGILSFTAAKNTDLVSSKDVATAIQAYERDPVAWEEEYQALADYNTQFVEQQYEKMDAFIPQYPGDVFEWEYTEEALRYLVYRDAKLHLDTKDTFDETYRRALSRVVKNAELAKEDYIAVGVGEDAYEYKYQNDIAAIYRVNSILPLEFEYTHGWEQYHSYNSGNILLVLLVLVLAPAISLTEHTTGMYPILHTAKHGRGKTLLHKLLVLATAVTCSVLLFSGINLIAFGQSYGFSSLGNLIQAFAGYRMCPEIITVGEYLLISVGIRILALFALGTVLVLLSRLIRSYALSFVASLGLVATQYVLYFFLSIDQTGSYDMLNVFTVMDTHKTFTRYYSLNLFGDSVPFLKASVFFYLAVVLLCTAGLFTLYRRTPGASAKRFKLRVPSVAIPVPCRNLFAAEVGKTLIASRYILLVIVVLIAKGVTASEAFVNDNAFSDQIYREYMTELEGELTEEKLAYIEAEGSRMRQAIAGFDRVVSDYRQGKITLEEYTAYRAERNYADARMDTFPVIEARRDYILSMKAAGKDAYFVYDTGWNALFNQGFDYLLYGLVLLLFAGVFANEIRGGIHNILKATGKGRWSLFLAKYAAVLILATLLFAAFMAIDLNAAMKSFEFPAWDAPVQSLTMFGAQPVMTVAQFVVLWITVKWLAVVLLVTALTGISLLSGKVLNTMAIVATVTLMPFLLRRFGLVVAQYFDFTYLLEGTSFLTTAAGSGLYLTLTVAVLAAVIMILTWLAKQMWVGRKHH